MDEDHGRQEQRFLMVKEVASLLRLDPQTVWRLIWRGGLPVIRIGRNVRIDRDELERWLNDQKYLEAA